ncbi:MAG: alpha/beta hydrolase [Bacteroidota bacterium]|nr:alpha/beta hydrolase [Bacteroidota bacterium]
MNAQKLSLNGTTIYCKGNLEKNSIVFLHGNSLSSSTFQNQFHNIDLPLVAIDLPGHGDSDYAETPENIYSIPGYAKTVTSVIDQLKLNNFIIAGHSLGGHIAINVASQLKGTSGVFVFGTPPLDSVNSLGNAFLPNPLFPFLLQGTISHEDASRLADSMLHIQTHKDVLKEDIMKTDPSARSSFGAFVAQGVIADEVAIIKKINFTTAIIHGEKDSFISKEYIEGVGFSNLWKNKVHQIDDSGHCPQMEQPEAFNELLIEYYKFIFGH